MLEHPSTSLLPVKPRIITLLLWLTGFLVLLLLFVVGWLIWASLTQAPTTHQHLEQILLDNNRRLQFTNCILLFEPEERTPAAIAECQTILNDFTKPSIP